MRVTEMMRYNSMTRVLTQLSSKQAKAAEQALTGSRIGAPSDDPMAAAQIVRLKSQRQELAEYREGMSTARGDIDYAENTLGQASDLMLRVKELAMQGANSTLPDEGRASLAQEVESLREEMVRLANTQGSRGYLFSGTNTTTLPWDSNGNYAGNNESQMLEVGRGVTVAVSPSGPNAFNKPGGQNAFAVLNDLVTALRGNDISGIQSSLDTIDDTHTQIVAERSRVGLTLDRLTSADSALEFAQGGLDKQTNELGAADPFEAYSASTTFAQALERAVAVSQQILNLGSLSRI
ncbi:MAG: flagellar hook-associated protein FlgL [Myxococcota bacterium]|jgi:flagellar hook-associated protein 3 FlgL|nr:flagellar hook-associated protein FlgL [Myxococcota bacterium]